MCMESPAVDFKTGIFTGNEHERYAERSDEQKLKHDFNELQRKHKHLADDYHTLYNFYHTLQASTEVKNVARLEKENSKLRADLETLQKRSANAHQHKAHRAHGAHGTA